MAWHDYPLAIRGMAATAGRTEQGLIDHMQEIVRRDMITGARKVAFINSLAHFGGELRWTQAHRPYYDVYPSVVRAFLNVDLDKLLCDHVRLPIPDLLVRFQPGHELPGGDGALVRSFLVSMTEQHRTSNAGMLVGIDEWREGQEVPNHTVTVVSLAPGTTVMSRLVRGREITGTLIEAGVNDTTVDNVFRFAVALCLLKDQMDLVSPEPLEADRSKWDATHDPKLLEKAARRGKRCWSIGKHIEVAPGFRRPHFAIRWMGKGGTDPRLRPIKGCLVRREKLAEVPTGYLDIQLDEEALAAVESAHGTPAKAVGTDDPHHP